MFFWIAPRIVSGTLWQTCAPCTWYPCRAKPATIWQRGLNKRLLKTFPFRPWKKKKFVSETFGQKALSAVRFFILFFTKLTVSNNKQTKNVKKTYFFYGLSRRQQMTSQEFDDIFKKNIKILEFGDYFWNHHEKWIQICLVLV